MIKIGNITTWTMQWNRDHYHYSNVQWWFVFGGLSSLAKDNTGIKILEI